MTGIIITKSHQPTSHSCIHFMQKTYMGSTSAMRCTTNAMRVIWREQGIIWLALVTLATLAIPCYGIYVMASNDFDSDQRSIARVVCPLATIVICIPAVVLFCCYWADRREKWQSY